MAPSDRFTRRDVREGSGVAARVPQCGWHIGFEIDGNFRAGRGPLVLTTEID
jgi:hypothetical protein